MTPGSSWAGSSGSGAAARRPCTWASATEQVDEDEQSPGRPGRWRARTRREHSRQYAVITASGAPPAGANTKDADRRGARLAQTHIRWVRTPRRPGQAVAYSWQPKNTLPRRPGDGSGRCPAGSTPSRTVPGAHFRVEGGTRFSDRVGDPTRTTIGDLDGRRHQCSRRRRRLRMVAAGSPARDRPQTLVPRASRAPAPIRMRERVRAGRTGSGEHCATPPREGTCRLADGVDAEAGPERQHYRRRYGGEPCHEASDESVRRPNTNESTMLCRTIRRRVRELGALVATARPRRRGSAPGTRN